MDVGFRGVRGVGAKGFRALEFRASGFRDYGLRLRASGSRVERCRKAKGSCSCPLDSLFQAKPSSQRPPKPGNLAPKIP